MSQVVSHDGTLFQRSGLISGGSSELRNKAKRWDEKHLEALRKRKDELTERLRESIKVKRKEPELVDLRASIKGLDYRLKYSRQNREQAETKTVPQLSAECDALEAESAACEPSIRRIEERMAERASRIAGHKRDAERAEDEIFGGYCRDIGVANIRVYEERELAGQQANVKRRMQFEESRSRLDTKLEFEKSRDTAKAHAKWNKEVSGPEHAISRERFFGYRSVWVTRPGHISGFLI